MKQLLTLILLLITLTSCSLFRQDMHKRRVAADSSATRSAKASEAWTREVVTEYVPVATDIPLSQSRLSVGLDAARVYTPLVHYVPGKEKIIRQTLRETGQKQQSTAEQKTASVQEVEKQRDYSPLIERGLLLFTVFLVLMGLAILLGVVAAIFRKR